MIENLTPLENHPRQLDDMISMAFDIAAMCPPDQPEAALPMVNSTYRSLVVPSKNENDDMEIMRLAMTRLVHDLIELHHAFGLYQEEFQTYHFHALRADDFLLRKEPHAPKNILAPPRLEGPRGS